MKFFSRKAAVASLAALGALTAVPAMASPASATPTQCSISVNFSNTSSNCLGGTGEHRIVCFYTHHIPGVGTIIGRGPWQPVGATSTTYCPQDRVTNTFVEVR
ncbi:hypothetical protein D0T12_03220 [Actinomadura spongiicola]|uniref:Secreted protein n=1 Tax=Actinomadura spongiicola TaxID=2303421 RepID=A0A372GQ33_9ACTN|nr:hypothetical protein [Actinomadura spongiicola]RFS87262.1 hypothetical protein D0T12_03220 [Actinomadura spongiicola]